MTRKSDFTHIHTHTYTHTHTHTHTLSLSLSLSLSLFSLLSHTLSFSLYSLSHTHTLSLPIFALSQKLCIALCCPHLYPAHCNWAWSPLLPAARTHNNRLKK